MGFLDVAFPLFRATSYPTVIINYVWGDGPGPATCLLRIWPPSAFWIFPALRQSLLHVLVWQLRICVHVVSGPFGIVVHASVV